ncbi:hypothetical protein Bbelb_116830 [Branchiostoma belcheri]|nr:hypothetical protein Bbelb_116830 [Branchiostoma belcheri]
MGFLDLEVEEGSLGQCYFPELTMKLCAVVQCSNSTYQLGKWKSKTCQKHGTKMDLAAATVLHLSNFSHLPLTRRTLTLGEDLRIHVERQHMAQNRRHKTANQLQ